MFSHYEAAKAIICIPSWYSSSEPLEADRGSSSRKLVVSDLDAIPNVMGQLNLGKGHWSRVNQYQTSRKVPFIKLLNRAYHQ